MDLPLGFVIVVSVDECKLLEVWRPTMLILSRRPNETIRFPQLGISISIVSVKGRRVQVGIEAPPEIKVLRKELEPEAELAPISVTDSTSSLPRSQSSQAASDKLKHDLRNRLNKAVLGIHLAQKQLAAGQFEPANRTLEIALTRLRELEAGEASESIEQLHKSQDTGLGGLSTDTKSFVAQPRAEYRIDGGKKVDILLVEDDPNERALLSGLLELEGYRVHTASNGHEAIGCLQRFTPRFVLLDMMMPECDGRETLQRIRQIPAFTDLPIFAVSGSSPDSVGLSIGSDGVEDWFPKPLNATQLVRHMRERAASLSS